MKYSVQGNITISVAMRVEADSPEEAIEKAYNEWPGLCSYAGNGATSGKLIGTSSRNLYIESNDDEPEFTAAFERDES